MVSAEARHLWQQPPNSPLHGDFGWIGSYVRPVKCIQLSPRQWKTVRLDVGMA